MRKLAIVLIFLAVSSVCWAGRLQESQLSVIALRNGVDTTAPTVDTATIGTNGTTLTLGMSETVTRSGGTFDVDCTTAGSNLTATYSSGSGSNSLVYTLGTTVNSGDTCNLDYNGASNGIEDAAGNDLAAITDKAVTNNSIQGGTPTLKQDLGSSYGDHIGVGDDSAHEFAGYSFTASSSYTLTSVKMYMYIYSAQDPFAIHAYIHAASGTAVGSRLATSTNTINAETLTGPGAYYEFTFSGVSLTNATRYYVVVDSDYSAGISYVIECQDGGSEYFSWSADGSTGWSGPNNSIQGSMQIYGY